MKWRWSRRVLAAQRQEQLLRDRRQLLLRQTTAQTLLALTHFLAGRQGAAQASLTAAYYDAEFSRTDEPVGWPYYDLLPAQPATSHPFVGGAHA